MAIVASNLYSGRVITGDSGYPSGKAQDIVNGEKGTGTPLRASWVNDQWGFLQALLDAANITPSGTPDQVGQSDYLDAIKYLLDQGVSGGVAGEATIREDADNLLQSNIDTEIINRTSADNALSVELDKVATEEHIGRVEKATSLEALTGEVDKFMDASLTQEVIQEYGLNVVKELTVGDTLDTSLPVGFYNLSSSVTSLPDTVTTATAISINNTQEGLILVGDSSNRELYLNWQESEVFGSFVKINHSGNTNPNLFSSTTIGEVIGRGYGTSTTTGRVFLPLNSYSKPNSSVLNGTFDIKSVDGLTVFATGATSLVFNSSESSPKTAVLDITGLTGITNEQPLVIHSAEIDSSILIE